LLQGIIQSSSLSNRDDIVAQLQQMSQPDPAQEQAAQQAQQMEMAFKQSQTDYYNSSAEKNRADAQKKAVETELMPQEAEAKMIGNISRGASDTSDFDKRVKIAELALKEESINSGERITAMQMQGKQQKQ
jgi:hypothetical protein